MSNNCLFCRIIRREIPATLIHEDGDTVAFRDVNPQAPIHVVVIPKQHVASLDAVTEAMMVGRLGLVAAEIARKEGIDKSGYRTVINTNADAGQTIFHIHLHLLGGRKLGWPPG